VQAARNIRRDQIEVRNEWETPQWLFDWLDAEFKFDLDPCATPHNTKCKQFFTKKDNGLLQDWRGYQSLFINPPYGRGLIEPWVNKAIIEHNRGGPTCVMLLPSRTGQEWFGRCLKRAHRIMFMQGRVSFIPPPGVAASSNREDSIIVVFKDTRLPSKYYSVSTAYLKGEEF